MTMTTRMAAATMTTTFLIQMILKIPATAAIPTMGVIPATAAVAMTTVAMLPGMMTGARGTTTVAMPPEMMMAAMPPEMTMATTMTRALALAGRTMMTLPVVPMTMTMTTVRQDQQLAAVTTMMMAAMTTVQPAAE